MDLDKSSMDEKISVVEQLLWYQRYFHIYHTLIEKGDISVKGQSFHEFIQESLNQTRVLEKKTNTKIRFYSNASVLSHAARMGNLVTLVLDRSFIPMIISEIHVSALQAYKVLVKTRATHSLEDKEFQKMRMIGKFAFLGPSLYLISQAFKFYHNPSIAVFASSMNILLELGRVFFSNRLLKLSTNLKLYREQERILTVVDDFASTMNTEVEKEHVKKKI